MLKYDSFLKKSSNNTHVKVDTLHAKVQQAIRRLQEKHRTFGLGYLNLPQQDLTPFFEFERTLSANIKNILVLGIGGSSLGPRAVYDSWTGKLAAKRRLLFSENVDAISYHTLISELDPQETLVLVITKSGSTIETMSKFWHLFEFFSQKLGSKAVDHFVAITDPDRGPLREMVKELNLQAFDVPSNVGGRFSVMTPVGLIPLLLVGFPIDTFLAGGQAVTDALSNPDSAIASACVDHFSMYQQGFSTTVMMPYFDAFSGFSEWFCQLWGESLAKAKNVFGQPTEVSLTPLHALGTVDQHSQLQLFIEGKKDKHIVFVERAAAPSPAITIPSTQGFPNALSHLQGKTLTDLLVAEARGTQAALERADVPISRWIVDDSVESVGAMMMVYMVITSVMGDLLEINPYDQPGVEFGKKVAHGLLGREDCADEAQIAEKLSAHFIDL